MNAVLYIDDQEEELQTLRGMIGDRYRVDTCRDGRSAAAIISKRRPRLVLLDINMHGYDGFRVLSDIQAMDAPPPVVMLSRHKEPHMVVRAMKSGAADFFSKPYASVLIRTRLERLMQEDGIDSRAARVSSADAESILLGGSQAMRATRETLARYAKANLPVLLLGESGTGKDRAARYVHACSDRAAGPLVVRNIAALPESLAESELFGCERGAFTDARDRKGCFEAAHGGTLFLDEIADASPNAQAALLRIVEDGEVRKLGAETHTKADCRLLFATNREPSEIAAGKPLRQDLFFRISTLSVMLPPLRERPEDIPELVESFLAAMDYPSRGLTESAADYLMSRSWPGNVRQLRASVERAAVLARGEAIGAEHVRAPFSDLF